MGKVITQCTWTECTTLGHKTKQSNMRTANKLPTYNVSVDFRLLDQMINRQCDDYVKFTKEDDTEQVLKSLVSRMKTDRLVEFLDN